MRILKFFIALLLTVCFTYSLNKPIEKKPKAIPAIGKLLNPFTGFWANGEAINRFKNESFTFKQLTAKAEVVYDEQLVPHIFAENLKDAFFIQGFITAKHRLWQMDISTRATSGRLSEIMGERTLKNDQLQRRKGLVFAAENTLQSWEKHPDDIQNLDSYTAGINAYIHSLKPGDYPLEFKLLDYEPEEWTNLKSAIFIKSMSQSLCMRENDLESTNALTVFGQETFDFLYPEQNPKQSPIIPAGTPWEFAPIEIPEKKPILMGLYEHKPHPKPSPFSGSNNWAVSGKKTKSGNTILCNDPHLNMTLPSVWFELQITTPQFSSYGVSLPGFPGITIGFNEHISWGMTNVGHDLVDFYKILWSDTSRENYILDDEIKPVRMKYETYHLKGGETVIDTVRYTEWGPIVYEAKEHPMKDLAMRWIAHDGGPNELSVFRKLSTSQNFDDYYDAVQDFVVPPQNIVFASDEGDIAIKVQGHFPLKRKSQGRFIQDGSNSDNGWHGFIPKAHNPQIKNPERGFVASANQHSTDTTYPYYYNGGFEDYRGRALNMFLDSMSNIDVEDMMNLQNNTFSYRAADALPSMLSYLEWQPKDEIEISIYNGLKNWNYYYEKELLAPVVFEYWFNEFHELTWDEIAKKEASLGIDILQPETWRTIALLADTPENSFFDIIGTPKIETAKDVVNQSFEVALAKIKEKLTKNSAYNLDIHKNTKVAHLGRIDAFGSKVLSVGGDATVLNAIRGSHGPSWRMIVEMSTPVKAYGVYPGGQSGNPGSPYYDNMLDYWAKGKYYEKLFLKTPEEGGGKILFKESYGNH
ncbi:MAG: penicillin amidase [Saprospiraceae bacterium]|jgi:penicillin amidase